MSTCAACGAQNPDQAKFCNQCGASLEAPCPNCGSGNPPGSRFCNHCGTPLGPVDASAPPQPETTVRAEPARTAPPVRPAMPVSALASVLALKSLPGQAAATESGIRRIEAEQRAAQEQLVAGERKQVTVMFADVSGFTSMSERLDPEEVHHIMNRCFEVLVKEVHRYEGTINQFTGDGIMALFGAPIARTDAAHRAVMAALAVQRELEDLGEALKEERGISFRMRIGLNTGMVVVGAVGTEARADYTAVGDTTNLAARVQQLAEPGTILITEHTYRLVEHEFACEALGPQRVKGKAEPVKVYRVLGVSAATHEEGRHGRPHRTPFRGREDEFRSLKKTVDRALAGEARVIGLVGEVGMGKSRLVHELMQTLDRSRVCVAQGHCLSYGVGIAFTPFAEIIQELTACEQAPPEAAAVLERAGLSGPRTTDGEPVGGLSQFLGGREEAGFGMLDDSAKRKTFGRIIDVLLDTSTHIPLLLIIEDLQWIDPSSEELLGTLINRLPGTPVCVLCTFTPEYRFPWADRSYYRHITIDPLPWEDGAGLVRSLLGKRHVPPEVLQLLREHTDGNPFFIQAGVRMLRDDGYLEDTPDGLRLARPLTTFHIPDTVQDIVMERIDRLPDSAKRALQVAAVIGRTFEVPILQAALEAEDVQPQLDALVEAEMITRNLGSGEPTYSFRQNITRDVAYTSQLRASRRELHGRIARAIERLQPDRLDDYLPRLGQHFARSDTPEKAVGYLRRSADRSLALGAMKEGARQLEQALAVLAHLPEDPDHLRARIEILQRLGEMRYNAGEMERARTAVELALELAREAHCEDLLGKLYVGLGGLYILNPQDQMAGVDFLKEGIALAEGAEDWTTVARASMHLGMVHRGDGRWDEARACFTRMVELSARTHSPMGQVVGQVLLAYTACDVGDLPDALAHAREALRIAEETGNEWDQAFASAHTADLFLEADEFERCEMLAHRALSMGERFGVIFAQSGAHLSLGRLALARNDCREAISQFKQCLERSPIGPTAYSGRIRLGEAWVQMGRLAQAEQCAVEAFESHPGTKDVGRAERLMASVLLHRSPPHPAAAGEHLQRATARYEHLGMQFELAETLLVASRQAHLQDDALRGRALEERARHLFAQCGATRRLRELAAAFADASDTPIRVL